MASLDEHNEEDLDTQIQIAADKRAKNSQALEISLGLGLMIFLLGLSILRGLNLPNVGIGFVMTWLTIWSLLILGFSSERNKWEQKLSWLRADKIDVRSELSKYCLVEDFNMYIRVGDELLKSIGWNDSLRCHADGRNYLKGTFDKYSFETSYLILYETYNYGPRIHFTGQIAFLTSSGRYHGKHLITRKYGSIAFTDINRSAYEHLLLNMFNYSRKRYKSSPVWKLKDVSVPVSDDFDKKWCVYSTNRKTVKEVLGTNTKLYDLFMNNTRLIFVFYDYDRIVFGGDYGQFKLSEGSLEEATQKFEDFADLFFNEAIPTVTLFHDRKKNQSIDSKTRRKR